MYILFSDIILCHCRFETSSTVQVEPKERLHFYPGGRVFQQHLNLGTYTLTFPGREEGAETQRSEESCLQEEVEELRRRIRLHRDKKVSGGFPVLMLYRLLLCCNTFFNCTVAYYKESVLILVSVAEATKLNPLRLMTLCTTTWSFSHSCEDISRTVRLSNAWNSSMSDHSHTWCLYHFQAICNLSYKIVFFRDLMQLINRQWVAFMII